MLDLKGEISYNYYIYLCFLGGGQYGYFCKAQTKKTSDCH